MKQANPADYIPRARSTPGAEYEGFHGEIMDGMLWHYRYVRLHAGRSILLDARESIKGKPPGRTWHFLTIAIREIEREIEEVRSK